MPRRGRGRTDMRLLDGVILGVIQGATEFLPVSSSGHLRIGEHMLGARFPSGTLFFEVALHLATLVAVALYFHREIRDVLVGFFRALGQSLKGNWAFWTADEGARWALWIIVASVPTAVIGLGLKKAGLEHFGLVVVGAGLLVTGLLDWSVERWAPAGEQVIGLRQALLIGIAQGLAVLPGISRSGSTICAGLFQGIPRKTAARFSFLASMPAIAGASLLEAKDLVGTSLPFSWGPLVAGMVAALVVGLLCLHGLMRMLAHGRFHYFAPYCWLVGLAAIVVGLR